ncbi:MAG TPA: TadE/TadG family type IV pilus assembly protein [Terracidiphilus sp.]|nr:TadE/TadG family type IV pilus assembly protein [Terracidiphilus sp.]
MNCKGLGLRKSRPEGESGQSLVETAFLVPLLVLVLMGAVEFGRVAYESIEVTNAAKAAVQYGAQNRTTAIDATGMRTAATKDAPNVSGLTTSVSTACTCSNTQYIPTSCSDNTTCSSHGAVNEVTLTVTTSATFSPIIHCPGLPGSITLHGQAVQRVMN